MRFCWRQVKISTNKIANPNPFMTKSSNSYDHLSRFIVLNPPHFHLNPRAKARLWFAPSVFSNYFGFQIWREGRVALHNRFFLLIRRLPSCICSWVLVRGDWSWGWSDETQMRYYLVWLFDLQWANFLNFDSRMSLYYFPRFPRCTPTWSYRWLCYKCDVSYAHSFLEVSPFLHFVTLFPVSFLQGLSSKSRFPAWS